jgi:hypothetical protein
MTAWLVEHLGPSVLEGQLTATNGRVMPVRIEVFAPKS